MLPRLQLVKMDKKSQLKTIGIFILLVGILAGFIYAISGTPVTSDNTVDDDGYLDLRASCIPTSQSTTGEYDGTTSYNITNATIYSNVDGTWKANATIQVANAIANSTYFFNFTNNINKSAEGTFKWSVLCNEQNASSGKINTIFTANRTIIVNYADVSLISTSPADNVYVFDGINIPLVCTGTAANNWNITFAEVMVAKNTDGYSSNQSYTPIMADDAEIVFNATLGNYTDGTDVTWACRYTQIQNRTDDNNYTITSITSSANRTINIEFPPTTTLNLPTTNSWQTEAESTLNFTIVSTFVSNNLFTWQLFTNETGSWIAQRSGSAVNNTQKTINYQFPNQLSDIRWGIKAFENTDNNIYNLSVNFTVSIDRTVPITTISLINLSSAINNSYFNTLNLVMNYSVTENYPNSCNSYINASLNATASSSTNAGNFVLNITEGVWTIRIGCNDSAGNFYNSTIYYFNIDTTFPTLSGINNRTPNDYSNRRIINLSASEIINVTLYYGTTTDTTSTITNNSFGLLQNITLYNLLENTIYYWNLTICDRAGNCNNTAESIGQFSVTFPWMVKGIGWSYYAIYDALINFSTILNQTSAEFVYYWNATGQGWVYATAGGTSSMEFQVGTSVNRQVIHLYEQTNSTWDLRNTSNSNAVYYYNFTSGDNYIKIPAVFTFGNFSRTLLNGSYNTTGLPYIDGYGYGWGPTTQTPEGRIYNLTSFAFWSYNNSKLDWDDGYIYNWSLNNNTPIFTDLSNSEVMWIWSESNISWNTTHIYANWTR